jgi:hypothetical protein
MIYCGAMSEDAMQSQSSSRRHEKFRKFGAYKNWADPDAELRTHWWSKTPEERMEALEELRILNYGQEAIDARVSRVFGVPESRRC